MKDKTVRHYDPYDMYVRCNHCKRMWHLNAEAWMEDIACNRDPSVCEAWNGALQCPINRLEAKLIEASNPGFIKEVW